MSAAISGYYLYSLFNAMREQSAGVQHDTASSRAASSPCPEGHQAYPQARKAAPELAPKQLGNRTFVGAMTAWHRFRLRLFLKKLEESRSSRRSHTFDWGRR
jgi:hypothetical protein